ncbi:aminoacyl-histidine dipeptidase [Brachyspira catarrhinii]|uniref:Aminoacyl-histidine dipeptidase n=1 Tax=Brachyspira catarrhinii TaxID=2528966 RepID=A0ABY2TPX6_9SPIR|nr:aminoacyl-histidine dipeptidase [Brachyspira catarrhinii]TKZ33463.1 aminoacyl-histidine dipeptidase [Brachyspira catarrhinii]
MDIKNIESKEVFKWFEEISKIPRESGNEKEISDFLVEFARERNFEVYRDSANNVIIKKCGTSKYENKNAVIIQGHMDMVCENTKDSKHDFRKDAIELIVEGDILKANGTTLGGDDGIAIAMGLALLDSKNIPHPPIEFLATTSEETGMDGALAITGEHLNGKSLINIDSEEEGIFLVSCAGGLNTLTEFEIKRDSVKENKENFESLKIEISGLKGGHSGIEIDKQRANAIKILGRLLYAVKKDICLSFIEGGAKHNAIAKNSEAIIITKDADKIKNILEELSQKIKNEYKTEDSQMQIKIEKCENVNECITKEISDNIIDFMNLAPNGVLYMSREINGLVQTSANNGVLKEENGKLTFTISIRSSLESSTEEIASIVEIASKRTGAKFEKVNWYPAWEYDKNSKIKDIALSVYKKVAGKEAKIEAIHAGLECGILKRVLPEVDMISLGPNLYDVHTPAEHLSISSVDRTWKFLKELIINLN